MPSILPVNVDHLVRLNGVESARVEFKATWDEVTTGPQVMRTLCAFANDFQNLNGGYLVLGVEETGGAAVLPPKGLTPEQVEAAQIWIRGRCNTLDPVYQPVFSPEWLDGRLLLVLWAPGSDARPHQVPESSQKGAPRRYFIRIGSETVDTARQPELMTQLMQLTARVPFDDRRSMTGSMLDVRETKVREFLHDVGSALVDEPDTRTLYRHMRIATPVNGHDAPKNIGLLFFSQNPEQWFPGARIEVVQFSADSAGNVIDERIFAQAPIHEQLRACLGYLENLSSHQIRKHPVKPLASRWVSYPAPALREALVNAVYHRSYEGSPEPTKVYLYPDRMEIISYPGPVPGIEARHLDGSAPLPPVPARNRRIGELLKELKLAEGRGTGIPKVRRVMQQNGSPPPVFDFDTQRTYFRVTLPAHPEYRAMLALQDVGRLKALGERQEASLRLSQAFDQDSGSLGLAIERCRECITEGDLHAAQEVYRRFTAANPFDNPAPLIHMIAAALLNRDARKEARFWLDQLRESDAADDNFEAAIQEHRAGRWELAHKYFKAAGQAVLNDAKALHEFAQVKKKLAAQARRQRSSDDSAAIERRLLKEAGEMLQRVVQMDAPSTRRAWAWFDLGDVLQRTGAPIHEVRHAFEEACRLQPEEPRFKDKLGKLGH